MTFDETKKLAKIYTLFTLDDWSDPNMPFDDLMLKADEQVKKNFAKMHHKNLTGEEAAQAVETLGLLNALAERIFNVELNDNE